MSYTSTGIILKHSTAGLISSRACLLAYPSLVSQSRLFSSAPVRRNALSDKTAQAASTSKHSHRPEIPVDNLERVQSGITNPPQTINGDWVLFHPVYTSTELKSVEVLHRDARSWQDKFAYSLVKLARFGFDISTGYRHQDNLPKNLDMATIQKLRKRGHLLDDHAWLVRILLLETIAGVPGSVAATLRHLTSLRLLKRDSGWIHTLLEEAENERMHLLTFMTLRKPSLFLRGMIMAIQGVFCNLFFLSYMISPKICHRFVGYLEEEAVHTYSQCIKDLEAGRIPEWSDKPAPDIAIDYWRLKPNATLLDVIYSVRADESTHRFVNHSLANLNQKTDVNPFSLREPKMQVKGKLPGFERAEAEKFVLESHEMLEKTRNQEMASVQL